MRIVSSDTLGVEYVAGFFDGEGCISITRTNKGLPRLMVLYTNNALDLLEAIRGEWGGRIYKQSANRGPLNERRQSYILQFNQQADQERFLRAVEPHLRIKRQQAINALEFLEVKRVQAGSHTSEWARKRLENCFLRAKLLSSRRLDNLPEPPALPDDEDGFEQIVMEGVS